MSDLKDREEQIDVLDVATIIQDRTGCESGPAVGAAAEILTYLESVGWDKAVQL